MNSASEKFYVFIHSALDEKERTQLFQFIWENYGKKIYFYISGILPLNHPYKDDLFQEIMIKIYKNLHTFNPVYPLRPWIYKITKNHCLNFIKSKKEKIHSSKEFEYDTIKDTDNPEKQFFRDAAAAEIDKFTKALNPTDREIFYLRFYESLKYKHIGEIMDMNINTVKSRVHLMKLELKNKVRGGQ
ncbi:MAG: sigma-70 family RNA polymerase sigma factor [Candidatus Aminicenantes bacterium]|nr:sigma-70 family RNA polymerase sigma factor [Candidatus Aminicenantes bacterium]NIM83281.1 sigma-70 family RNA polymerase sigma factor [Candidatus Aminicenantes bacterium]NIN22652.1 sigma-70 family RNA polymerase sigma factor [Candidatus Aminicenantes bacterium]NIN46411.1 sigma-70 family RNA polymerase sigma factor [Candidatus Aminicenantes bacterium]NIN89261.1 sigma-70 family RNA polymerase sigma factor [Candidatus Aminicenantes bacterium]